MDHPVWWDEETTTVVVHCTVCTLVVTNHYRYVVKEYFYKIAKVHT
jgi:hypothetical protein